MNLAENIAWLVAVGVTGFMVFSIAGSTCSIFLDWLRRPPEPTDHDVRHAAEQYRTYFGADALSVIGEHSLAATFTPDGRHKRFLQRVTEQLMREEGIVDDVRLDELDSPQD